MRQKRESVLSFVGKGDELPKTVREYREKFKGISVALDLVPKVLDLVHRDLLKLTEGGRKGRNADFTSETLLRSLVVMTVEGLSYRETVVRIAESEFLQDFIRTRKKAVMDHTFLSKCFKAIRPQTWKRVNELLAAHCVKEGCVDPSVIRTDTTVVESNIHWPTDSSLLWDTWRVASRILRRARTAEPRFVPHRFHDRKIKRLHLNITRYSASKSKARQRLVKRSFRTLIQRVVWIVGIAQDFCQLVQSSLSLKLMGLDLELSDFLPAMRQVVEQASRAQLDGEKVPAKERVFSIFESHTELIKRGRRHKPVEFGHAVLLCQTREKFITDYEAFEHKPADCDLTVNVIDRHEHLFGEAPEVLAVGGHQISATLATVTDVNDRWSVARPLVTGSVWDGYQDKLVGSAAAVGNAAWNRSRLGLKFAPSIRDLTCREQDLPWAHLSMTIAVWEHKLPSVIRARESAC